jgi:ADP-heptose:LPS heptosyltransferase
MGFGGALIWSGLARDLKAHYPDSTVAFIYDHPVRSILKNRYPLENLIYANNPDIDILCVKSHWKLKRFFVPSKRLFVVDLNDPKYFYWEKATEERMILKKSPHAIQIMASEFGIPNSLLQPTIRFYDGEVLRARMIQARYGLTQGKYICVEPCSKESWTPNRAWFEDRWLELIQQLKRYIKEKRLDLKIVQLGAPQSSFALDGVINLQGLTTFRECGLILQDSRLFISTEGGLTHLAAAVKTPSVVIMSGYNPKELMSYPQNINLYHDMPCSGCGLRIPCELDRQCAKTITVEEAFEAALKTITE